MPYVIVEGILGGVTLTNHRDEQFEFNTTRIERPYSPRQGVERSPIQKTKQTFYAAVSGLKGKYRFFTQCLVRTNSII